MIDYVIEIAKHLGMQGLVISGCGYYILFLTRSHVEERESQRLSHQKERDNWSKEERRRQEQLIDVITQSNKELSSIRLQLKGKDVKGKA